MQFFKFLLIIFSAVFYFNANASELKTAILSHEYGSCETNNLYYSAMKFYKIPLNQKIEKYDLFLRVIFFFNDDGSLSQRITTQALLGCQTTSDGTEACSYSPVDDRWNKSVYDIQNDLLIPDVGVIKWEDPTNVNRGFTLTFSSDFSNPELRNKSFVGGMVSVNFDQNGKNTINICK